MFDGWHLIDELKGDPQTWDIPIVMLTSQAESAVSERAARQGCAAVLRKPYRPDELARALRDILGRPPSDADHSAAH